MPERNCTSDGPLSSASRCLNFYKASCTILLDIVKHVFSREKPTRENPNQVKLANRGHYKMMVIPLLRKMIHYQMALSSKAPLCILKYVI